MCRWFKSGSSHTTEALIIIMIMRASYFMTIHPLISPCKHYVSTEGNSDAHYLLQLTPITVLIGLVLIRNVSH